MTEINKCPVCGDTASLEDEGEDRGYWYGCDSLDGCGVMGPTKQSAKEALAAWNRLSYKAPVKKTAKVAWVSKTTEGGGKLSFAILLDTADTEPYYRGLGYNVVEAKEVEFEIE